jgi:TPR repeat protein
MSSFNEWINDNVYKSIKSKSIPIKIFNTIKAKILNNKEYNETKKNIDEYQSYIIGHNFEIDGNIKKAIYWYQRAARMGNDVAQYKLGLLLETRDLKTSLYWYSMSAKQLNMDALNVLWDIYRENEEPGTKMGTTKLVAGA